MLNRRIVAGLALLSTVAAVNFLAACTPSDDSDTFATPTPAPEPPGPQRCQINWTTQYGDGTIEAFTIDAPEDFWKVGGAGQPFATLDTAFNFQEDGFIGVNILGASISSGVVEVPLALAPDDGVAFVGTDGAFTLSITVNETNDGADVDITDAAGTLFLLDTAGAAQMLGTLDDGDFDGFWSARGSSTPDLANFTVSNADFDIGGTYTIGDYGSWAICYEQH